MVKIVHNMRGYTALRTDPAVAALCEDLGAMIANRAEASADDPDASYDVEPARTTLGHAPRVRVSVHPGNYAALADQARHNTLLAALGGA